MTFRKTHVIRRIIFKIFGIVIRLWRKRKYYVIRSCKEKKNDIMFNFICFLWVFFLFLFFLKTNENNFNLFSKNCFPFDFVFRHQ